MLLHTNQPPSSVAVHLLMPRRSGWKCTQPWQVGGRLPRLHSCQQTYRSVSIDVGVWLSVQSALADNVEKASVCERGGRGREGEGGGGRERDEWRGTSGRMLAAYWGKMGHLDASTNTNTTLIEAVDEASFCT